MNRRTALKWLHWLSFGFIVYFYFVIPPKSMSDPAGALSTHAGVGVLMALVLSAWLGMYLYKGLASRPGPRLPKWGKRFHAISHRALQWGVPIVVASGAFTGFVAPWVIRAFGWVPISPGGGARPFYRQMEEVHAFLFDALVVLILVHAGFHIWRHYRLRDNALRIMVPKSLHRFL